MKARAMMKNPAHPGGLIRDNIEELGLSIAEAAKGFGVTRQQLYRLINGHQGLTPEMALRLEQAFGGSAAPGCECRSPMTSRGRGLAFPLLDSRRRWREFRECDHGSAEFNHRTASAS
jgi:addiction module HigA family antidote